MANDYRFIVYHNEDFVEFQLDGNKTVEDIKIKIFHKFEIYPSKQRLEGLSESPISDDQKLNSFLEFNENILWVKSTVETNKTEDNLKNMNMEVENAKSHAAEEITASLDIEASANFEAMFLSEYGANHVTFHTCTLNEAIVESCFASVEHRKILALYLHNSTDAFAKMFCPTLCKGKIRDILEENFYFVGWDLSIDEYHSALRKSFSDNVDANLAHSMIMKKCAGLLIIYPIENSIAIFSVLYGPKVKSNAVYTTLEGIANNFKEEIKAELELKKLNIKKSSGNDIGSEQFQHMMCKQLGNRDYDSFEFNEHELLKSKIGFSKFGPPESEDGYDPKKLKEIETTFKQIQEYNNKFSEWNDQIVISFLYNCLEPLPKEKLEREKKYSDYNPNTDINPIPIYVIRKCHGSANPCRIFIDSDNRAYETWKDYIDDNKFIKCKMVLPKDGRYCENEDGQVLLEHHLSPACGIGHQVLKGTDIATTVLGIASGGVLVAAAIPTIAVAPFALAAAGVTGIGVGLYSLVRSGLNIYDRYEHGEDMSFANSESRGAYINIVAGTLGFVGAGATTVVSQLASQGVNLGLGARVVVNTISVANISASGIGIVNSSYQIFDDWIAEDQTPSLLTIVQLSSSILFFGNAVYNFKSVGTIIEEAQTGSLKEIQESLRSGRHRKMLDKLTKETIRMQEGDVQAGRSEVISAMRNIANRDEVMAVLTRNNKLFNKDGIRFSANSGEIQLNGIKVDMLEFGAMLKGSKTQVLGDLPGIPQPSTPPTDSRITLGDTINNVFAANHLSSYASMLCTGASFITTAQNILENYSNEIQQDIIKICKLLIDKALKSTDMDVLKVLSKYFIDISPNPLVVMLEFVVRYFEKLALEYEFSYEEAKDAAKQLDNFSETDFDAKYFVLPGSTLTKATMWFERGVYHSRRNIDGLLEDLLQFTMDTISKKMYDLSCEEERYQNRISQTTKKLHKIPCTVCNGYYFSTNPPKPKKAKK